MQHQRTDRRHGLRAVDQRQSFLRLQHDGREAHARERLAPRQHVAADLRLPFPDQRQRHVRQRRKVATRTDRALRRDHRMHTTIQALDQQRDDADADAAAAERERLRAQQQHAAHDLRGQRHADTHGM